MRVALCGSIAIHGGLLAALLLVASGVATVRAPDPPAVIELFEVQTPTPTPPAVDLHTDGGGGSVALREVTVIRRPASKQPTLADLADVRLDEDEGSSAGRGGSGAGGGRGEGEGNGDGDGVAGFAPGSVPPPPAPPAPPPPTPEVVTKAQPAKLVFPKREREVDDGQLFIARVIVDSDGYVVGARLVRGFGGPRDTEASDLIWRFRYEPARDAAGRAVQSTFEQRFLVNR